MAVKACRCSHTRKGKMKKYKNGDRYRLEQMPYDRDGMHATGYEVYTDGRWWGEYETPDGDTCLRG